MSNWYKQIVAKLKLTDVMPKLAHNTEVCRLDAERERLANEYIAADGALLLQIAKHLKNDGSGCWTDYIEKRILPGVPPPRDRMRIAMGHHVELTRFDRSAVYKFTHCPACDLLMPQCMCDAEDEYQRRVAEDEAADPEYAEFRRKYMAKLNG